jgi:hypothetical protein
MDHFLLKMAAMRETMNAPIEPFDGFLMEGGE